MAIGLFLDVDNTLTQEHIQHAYARVLDCEAEYLELEQEFQQEQNSDRFGRRIVELFAGKGFTKEIALEHFEEIELAPWAEDILSLDAETFLVSAGPSYYVEELARRYNIRGENVLCSKYLFDRRTKVISRCLPSSEATKSRFVQERADQFKVSIGVGDSVSQDGPFIVNCRLSVLTTPSDAYLSVPNLRVVKELVEAMNGTKALPAALTAGTPEPSTSADHEYVSCRPSADDIQWLESRSMLYQSQHFTDAVAGNHLQWQNAYARPRPKDFIDSASVWFTSYPKALVTEDHQSVVQTLASADLLSTLREIGIEGIHTGPMKRAGGIKGRDYTPTVDGFFDRIGLDLDPLFGTNQEYSELTGMAKELGIALIGDLVPAHTGKGPDFRLAERHYQNYKGLYTMVQIPEEDWWLLDDVPDGADSVNLSAETVQVLRDKGYIPGELEVTPFHYPGVKDTDWSATDVVAGVDGQHRRWVYLHVFKDGQPSLNWLDPTFAAQRVVLSDAIQSLHFLGDAALRLDATPLLGVEARPGPDKAWIEGHPLAEGSSNLIAMMIRKLGGHSFQEINASLDDLKRFVPWGPDLSYDFITRPPYLYAMVTGNAGPLRLMFRLMQREGLDPGIFVHALQNHDELMFDLCHLRTHADEEFPVGGETVRGRDLYDTMYREVKDVVTGDGSGCMREFSNLGFCGTMASFAAAACGITDPYNMTTEQREEVQELHLLAAVFNAMQPGVFALSGWDLVGALPVPPEDVRFLMEDEDYRWMNRGAFDLMGANPAADASNVGLPRAAALYGPLPDQLGDPSSFVSRLKEMLRLREQSGVALSTLVAVPEPDAEGLLVMLLQRPDDLGWIVTAINFGHDSVREAISLPAQVARRTAHAFFSTATGPADEVRLSDSGEFLVDLGPRQARVFVIGQPLQPSRPTPTSPARGTDLVVAEPPGRAADGRGGTGPVAATVNGKGVAHRRLARVLRGIRRPRRRRGEPVGSSRS
jgi:trehalose synthase